MSIVCTNLLDPLLQLMKGCMPAFERAVIEDKVARVIRADNIDALNELYLGTEVQARKDTENDRAHHIALSDVP